MADSPALLAGHPLRPSPDRVSRRTRAERTVLPMNKRTTPNSPPVSQTVVSPCGQARRHQATAWGWHNRQEPPSAKASTNSDRLARDVTRILGREKGDDARDFLRFAETTQGGSLGKTPYTFWSVRGHHVGIDRSGRDSIYPDPSARKSLGQCHGQSLHRRLAGRVKRPRSRLPRYEGTQVDDHPLVVWHEWSGCLGGEEHGLYVCSDVCLASAHSFAIFPRWQQ